MPLLWVGCDCSFGVSICGTGRCGWILKAHLEILGRTTARWCYFTHISGQTNHFKDCYQACRDIWLMVERERDARLGLVLWCRRCVAALVVISVPAAVTKDAAFIVDGGVPA